MGFQALFYHSHYGDMKRPIVACKDLHYGCKQLQYESTQIISNLLRPDLIRLFMEVKDLIILATETLSQHQQ